MEGVSNLFRRDGRLDVLDELRSRQSYRSCVHACSSTLTSPSIHSNSLLILCVNRDGGSVNGSTLLQEIRTLQSTSQSTPLFKSSRLLLSLRCTSLSSQVASKLLEPFIPISQRQCSRHLSAGGIEHRSVTLSTDTRRILRSPIPNKSAFSWSVSLPPSKVLTILSLTGR